MAIQNSNLDQVINLALKKKEVFQASKLRYLIKSALAGVYIGFGIVISYKLGEYFHDVQSPATTMMISMFFGIALVLIMYGGADLFTGNTMTFTISTLMKATTWKDTLQNWVACYMGNLIGAIFFAAIIFFTGLFNYPEKSQLMMEVAGYKMSGATVELFFKAILCNWLVCLAVWIPMNLKDEGAKILVMMILVFGFVVSGFEHSIANMVLFSISLMVSHPESISIYGAIHNLIPVTIGNIVGGSVFVGFTYVYVYAHQQVKVKLAPVEKKIQNVKSYSKF